MLKSHTDQLLDLASRYSLRLFMAALIFAALFYALYSLCFAPAYPIGDWLINYSGGFVRRGFFGEFILLAAHAIHIPPEWMVVLVQMTIYTAFLAGVYRLAAPQADASGNFSRGDGKENEDFFCFGHPLLAVAEGTVAAIHDGVPENPPGGRAVEIDYNNLTGNFVVLKIGDGIYAGYAHMQPGRLRVKVGDHVKQGDVLGMLGNTGNSDALHLHFQLMDSPSIAISEGLPYAFASFETSGTVNTDFHVIPSPPAEHKAQIPLEDVIVQFP